MIRGSGVYVPPRVITNEMLGRVMDVSDEWVIPRTGIRERRFAEPGVGSAELGAKAASLALADAGLTSPEIDLVIFATMTPDYDFPGNGALLAAQLGMTSTLALDVRMQCAGFLSGLQVADAFIRSGTCSRVLLVGAEAHRQLLSIPEETWRVVTGEAPGLVDSETFGRGTAIRDRVVLFGDGAGAMVLEANESDDGRGFLGFSMHTDGTHWDKLCFRRGPDFEAPLVDGGRVFRLAVKLVPQAVREVLGDAGRQLEEVRLLLLHQANLRICEAVQRALGLPDEKVFNNIQLYGNTTAATLPIAYHEAKTEGRVSTGDLVAFGAIGSGLHWGAALAVL